MASLDGNQEDKKPQAGDEAFVGGDLNQQEAVGQPQGENLSTSSSSTMVAGQQAPQAADTQQEGSAAGARFRNLRKYIDRSKTDMAGKIGSGLEKKESRISGQVGAEKERLYGAENKGGLVGESQDFWAGQSGKYVSNDENPTKAQETIGSTAQEIAGDEAQSAAFQKARSGEVQDLSIKNREGIESGLSGLDKSAQQLATEQGRFQSLRDNLGRGREYGAGAQKLDQLLLQTKRPELDKLNELRKNVGKTTGQDFRDLAQRKDESVSDIQSQAGLVSQNIETGLAGARDAEKLKLETALSELKDSRSYQEVTGRDSITTEELLAQLGYQTEGIQGDDVYAQSLYGLDPTEIQNLITEQRNMVGEVGLADVANQGTLDQLNALANLRGEDSQSMINEGNVGRYNFDDLRQNITTGVQDLVGDRKSQVEEYLAGQQALDPSIQRVEGFQSELSKLGYDLGGYSPFEGTESINTNAASAWRDDQVNKLMSEGVGYNNALTQVAAMENPITKSMQEYEQAQGWEQKYADLDKEQIAQSMTDPDSKSISYEEYVDQQKQIALQNMMKEYGMGVHGNTGQELSRGIYDTQNTGTGTQKSASQTLSEARAEQERLENLLKDYR